VSAKELDAGVLTGSRPPANASGDLPARAVVQHSLAGTTPRDIPARPMRVR
jgi:hypothetical protein